VDIEFAPRDNPDRSFTLPLRESSLGCTMTPGCGLGRCRHRSSVNCAGRPFLPEGLPLAAGCRPGLCRAVPMRRVRYSLACMLPMPSWSGFTRDAHSGR
jgi:hypothetical protein